MPSFGDNNPGHGSGPSRYPGTFMLALREALAKLNWRATAWKAGSVECTDANGQLQQVGLENLYRRLRQEPRDTWPEMLAELLGSVPAEAATPPADLSEVADRLLVRLGPPFSRREPNLDVWSLPLVPGHLVALLVIDYPSSMSYVTEKMIADSKQPSDYWYARALANLSEKSDASVLGEVHEETGLLQAQASDAYDSSRALLLDDLLPGHFDNGFFVIVPGRDHMFVVPLDEMTLMTVPWLREIAVKMHRELPYPISPELFWVRNGDWQRFEVGAEGENIVVKAPPGFEDVMARLRPEYADDLNADPPAEDGDEAPD